MDIHIHVPEIHCFNRNAQHCACEVHIKIKLLIAIICLETSKESFFAKHDTSCFILINRNQYHTGILKKS